MKKFCSILVLIIIVIHVGISIINAGTALGGIGCGSFEVCSDGSFANFITSLWQSTGTLKGTFAAIYTKTGKNKTAKILRLANNDEYSNVKNVTNIEYAGTLPVLKIKYLDKELPVNVELSAYSPLIPNNINDSSLPSVILAFTLYNPGSQKADVSLLLSWQNVLNTIKENTEEPTQTAISTKTLTGIFYNVTKENEDPRLKQKQKYRVNIPEHGEYFIATEKNSNYNINFCESWNSAGKDMELWNEFSQLGAVANPDLNKNVSSPAAALIVQTKLAPKEKKVVEFIVSWYIFDNIFPSYYAKTFDCSPAVAEYTFNKRQELLPQIMEWQKWVAKSNVSEITTFFPELAGSAATCYIDSCARENNKYLDKIIDFSDETLYISTQLLSDTKEFHLPVFLPELWVWVDYVPKRKLVLKFIKILSDKEILMSKIVSDITLNFEKKFVVKKNSVLNLSKYLKQ